MEQDEERAERYRTKAEEVRVVADKMTDPEVQKTLIGVAADYLAMAKMLDRMAESNRRIKAQIST